MKLTENTKVRIRVPKHLYESIQAELGKMEEGNYGHEEAMEEENLQEFDPKAQGAMDVLSAIPGIDKIAQIDPFIAGVTLVGMVAGALIAGPKIEAAYKAIMQKLKPAKQAELAAAAKEANVDLGGEAAPVDEVHELEEVLDLETLMEAVKDASKKKVKEKEAKIAAKKKIEAKEKEEAKIADDKKAEDAKKKTLAADAKKKAEAAKKK